MKDRRFSCLVFSANRKKERERKKKEAPGENPLPGRRIPRKTKPARTSLFVTQKKKSFL
jgi:hypothetical protein